MAKTQKQQPKSIEFPRQYRVIGGDISLKRPGFSVVYVERDEQGISTITNVETMSIDNKTDKKKSKGQLLNDILVGIENFFPSENDNIPTFYVREKYITQHNSIYEATIHKAVGLSDWYLWKIGSEWHEIYPNTIKKLITGSGKADKKQVTEALFHYVGERQYANDDESDATAVAIAWLIEQKQINSYDGGTEEC